MELDFVYLTQLSEEMLAFKSSVTGTVTYSPELRLGSEIYAAGDYLIDLLFSPEDSHNYLSVSGQIRLKVRKIHSVLLWNERFEVVFSKFQAGEVLNAVCENLETKGDYVYEPNEEGLLGLDAGKYDLKVIFVPHDINYEVVEAHSTLSIEMAMPKIEWNDPEPVFYGNSLKLRCYKMPFNIMFTNNLRF